MRHNFPLLSSESYVVSLVTIEVKDERFGNLSEEEAEELVRLMLIEGVYRIPDKNVELVRVFVTQQ